MSNHNFEDRFFKTRRILELTIFFFLAFSLLSFSYSDFVPVTQKAIYSVNPTITVKPYLVDRTPLITYKDAEFFREASKYRAEKIGKVFFKQVYLKDIVLEIEEDHPLTYDLDNNVVNKKLYHKFSLLTNNTSEYNCVINDKILNCDFIPNFNGTIELNVGLESLYDNYSESVVTINVLPVNDEPILKSNYSSGILETVSLNEEYDYNLLTYLNDPDVNTNENYYYYFSISQSNENYDCYQNNFAVNCTFYKSGPYNLSFKYPKYNSNLWVPFKFNVLSANQPPTYIENSLDAGETHFGNKSISINVANLFSDVDNNSLDYNYIWDRMGLNFTSCSITDGIFNCDFELSESSDYSDIIFTAKDSSNDPVESPIYRVALLNESDVEFIFDDYNKDSFKVVDTQAFDLPLKLKDLNFDVYDLNISIDNDLGNYESFVFDLLANQEKEFIFSDLVSNNPNEYTITPVINTKPIITSQIKVLSIANTAEALGKYFEIYPNILGDYKYTGDQPNNINVPNGIKFVLPFAIKNHLDVDVELESCVSINPGAGKVYNIENNEYKEFNSVCNKYPLFAKEEKITEDSIISLEAEDQSNWRDIYYNLSFNDKIVDSNFIQILVEGESIKSNYLTIPSYLITLNPLKINVLDQNTIYTISAKLSNGYVYEFLDINVCQTTAIYTDEVTYTGIKNDYGEILSPYCYVVPSVKYFIEDDNSNIVDIPNFKFKTFNVPTETNELFVINLGYYRNNLIYYYGGISGPIRTNLFSSYNFFNIN